MKNPRTDIIVALVIILVGLFFLFQAMMIEATHYQSAVEAMVGPPLVPIVISWLIVGLGGVELIMALVSQRRSRQTNTTIEYDDPENTDLTLQAVIRILITIGIGFAYVWLLSATGYIISTALVLAALLLLFGTYNLGKIVILTMGGTATYYFVFIWLMGIYDPSGWLIDVS